MKQVHQVGSIDPISTTQTVSVSIPFSNPKTACGCAKTAAGTEIVGDRSQSLEISCGSPWVTNPHGWPQRCSCPSSTSTGATAVVNQPLTTCRCLACPASDPRSAIYRSPMFTSAQHWSRTHVVKEGVTTVTTSPWQHPTVFEASRNPVVFGARFCCSSGYHGFHGPPNVLLQRRQRCRRLDMFSEVAWGKGSRS